MNLQQGELMGELSESLVYKKNFAYTKYQEKYFLKLTILAMILAVILFSNTQQYAALIYSNTHDFIEKYEKKNFLYTGGMGRTKWFFDPTVLLFCDFITTIFQQLLGNAAPLPQISTFIAKHFHYYQFANYYQVLPTIT